jgi:hypothetical protein
MTVGATTFAWSGIATAEEPKAEVTAPGVVKETEEQAAERRRQQREPITFDRHENSLNIKATNLFGRQITSSSPNIILGAQWNYRLHTETFVGINIDGMLTPARAPTSDQSILKYSTYSGGLTLAQSLFSYQSFRIVLNVNAGVGVIYLRNNPYGTDQHTLEKPSYKFVEPGAYITLFDLSGVQVGIMGSMRRAQLLSKAVLVQDEDLTSRTIGLTFRSMLH